MFPVWFKCWQLSLSGWLVLAVCSTFEGEVSCMRSTLGRRGSATAWHCSPHSGRSRSRLCFNPIATLLKAISWIEKEGTPEEAWRELRSQGRVFVVASVMVFSTHGVFITPMHEWTRACPKLLSWNSWLLCFWREIHMINFRLCKQLQVAHCTAQWTNDCLQWVLDEWTSTPVHYLGFDPRCPRMWFGSIIAFTDILTEVSPKTTGVFWKPN